MRLRRRRFTPLPEVFDALFRTYRERADVGLALMALRAFFYNAIFFFTSAAASSPCLTVSETFPLEEEAARPLAFAAFYAVGTGIGGVAGPLLFGWLIESGSRVSVFADYMLAALLMIAAAFVALRFSVNAERKPLEEVARPLAFTD